MKKISDALFSMFVNNQLSTKEMQNIEKQLIANDEAPATIYASVINYETNLKQANELLGLDNEKEMEKNTVNDAGIGIKTDSKLVENETKTIKNSMMNIRISKEEALKVQQLFAAYNESENQECTVEENLINFYLKQYPGVSIEEAREVVQALRKGVGMFNENLNKAFKEELDYVEQIKEMSKDLDNKQKYELYINFLSAIHVMNIQNFNEEKVSQIEGFETMKQGLLATEDVTEEMLEDVIAKIVTALQENTLCLGTAETMQELIESLPEGAEAVEDVLRGSENDMRKKVIMALIVYILHKNGELSSLSEQELLPEIIAVGVASGIEEMQILEQVRTGRTAVDTAIKIFKIIGGIALFTLFSVAATFIIANLTVFTFEFLIGLLGVSTIALIGSAALACLFWFPILSDTIKGIGGFVEWTGRLFDSLIDTWRESIWPTIKEKSENFMEWIGGLYSTGDVMRIPITNHENNETEKY